MIKKILIPILLLIVTVSLASCGAKTFTVTFDSQGGSAVDSVVVNENDLVTQPADPTRAAADDGSLYTFVNWATDAAGTNAYDFTTPVTADLTLYAIWTKNVVLNFDTKTSATVDPILLGANGGTVTSAPTTPTREGFIFKGWFHGKAGLTWLEPEAVSFPMDVTKNTTLYAYWEPIDSKTIQWSDDETYFSSMDSSSTVILNPMTYQWSHEDTLINMLATPLYSSDHVDWDKAIEDGAADYVGDFSKIGAGQFFADSLDYKVELLGATHFPIDKDGDEHLLSNGNYDRENASKYTSDEWTFNIRSDLYFENGVNITADTYEYTLKMFLDPNLLNYRANIYYQTAENRNGYPIKNAYEYYTGTADWSDVGFTKLGTYSFKITFDHPISQSSAVALGNIRLVEPSTFASSINSEGTGTSYGTPDVPYVSYGEYILKSWDENQKMVFNKNYQYIGKGDIPYKSRVIEYVDDVDQTMALFKAGDLSVAGLTTDYMAEYAESPNVFKSWVGYPQNLLINLADSQLAEGGNVHPTIMFDVRFRQALFYGFDRKYYANSVYQPNVASILPMPLDVKAYNDDVMYYSQTPQHLQVLDDLGIDPDTAGYIPTKAKTLFDAAYSDWINEGNTGPVKLNMVALDDEFTRNLVDYIKQSYEALFGTDKLEIDINYTTKESVQSINANWDYDLSLNNIGFGVSYGAQWQYPFLAYFGAVTGGATLGLSQPFDSSTDDGYASYYSEEVTCDLTNTYEYLKSVGEDGLADLPGSLALYHDLQETKDDDGNVTKAAGIFEGTLYDLAKYPVWMGGIEDDPWDAVASEPFAGASNDVWNMVAVFEKVFFETMPLVPTVTRASATIYADNVVILWPAYSTYFGWGTDMYRYLNTDPDFVDGYYNSYQVAYESQQS